MKEKIRKSGIDTIGDIPSSTHICQLYRTKEDLIDILIPYFKAGLENNEFCIWVTQGSFTEKEAKEALRKDVPDLDKYLKGGQMEFVLHTKWHLKGGAFNPKGVLNDWVEQLNQAKAKGYDGMRVTVNTTWLKKSKWKNIFDYEEQMNHANGTHQIMTICTYPLDECGASEVITSIRNHQYTLIKREDEWEVIKSPRLKYPNRPKKDSEGGIGRVIKSSLGSISVTNLKENMMDYDSETFDLYGGSSDDSVIGKRVYELIAEKETKKMLKQNIAKSFESAFMAAARGTFPPELSGGAVLASTKDHLPFTAVANNIASRKILEEKLVQSEKLVGIGTLASGIINEINNPLAGIMGYAEIMKDENNLNLMKKYAERIVCEAERVSDIVKWLSKYSSPAKDLNITALDLNGVIDESLEALKHTHKSFDIQIEKDYHKISNIMGNRGELLQIFVNLLSNAADAMCNGGRLHLSTTMNHEYVEVKVSDDGIGIPRKDINRIFEPFFTTKEVGKGTGLGLYVLSMIVKKHHGTIDVDSEVGMGSTFTLRFPLSEVET